MRTRHGLISLEDALAGESYQRQKYSKKTGRFTNISSIDFNTVSESLIGDAAIEIL